MSITFTEFVQSKVFVDDIGAKIGIEDYNGKSGYVYIPDDEFPIPLVGNGRRCDRFFLEEPLGEFWTNLADAEQRLYDYARSEGMI